MIAVIFWCCSQKCHIQKVVLWGMMLHNQMAKFIRSWGTTTGSTMLSLMILAFVAANSNIQRISWSGYQLIQSFKLFATLAIFFFFITSFSLASVFFLEKALKKCRSSGSSPGNYSGQWDQLFSSWMSGLLFLGFGWYKLKKLRNCDCWFWTVLL